MAVTSANPFTYAFVTEDTQTVVATESSSIRLDWSKWITEELGGSAISATYTLHRTQLDEYRNPIGPTVQFNVTANECYIQVTIV